jgi:hypothetical protein
MMKFAWAIVLGLSTSALAEGGCPPGQYPQQGNGWRSCVPGNSPTAQSGGSEFIGPTVEARWVTLSVDTQAGILGHSHDSRTQDEAEHGALSDCASQGGTACQVVVTSKNGCVALAVGDSRFEARGAATKTQAESKAMDACTSFPSKNCRVMYSACVAPVTR